MRRLLEQQPTYRDILQRRVAQQVLGSFFTFVCRVSAVTVTDSVIPEFQGSHLELAVHREPEEDAGEHEGEPVHQLHGLDGHTREARARDGVDMHNVMARAAANASFAPCFLG